ncbi:radical SAM family heme chaperone HemW [Candidatus Saganbacteria bacterium]|nr:radical SAM family heme chaperone HemW [Candidatus Saganbacteria bacterium]
MTNDQHGINSIYIHIPFCKQKCSYCDFVSYAGKDDLIDKYVDALCEEISTPSSFLLLGKGENAEQSEASGGTIYFGGGTPTLLKPKHFEKIIKALTPSLRSSPLPLGEGLGVRALEVTIETNPGTVDKEYLVELRKLGINRISFGAQSFNEKHLKLLGRIHDSKQIFNAVEDARAAGFDNLSLDLIFAIPDQTLDEWKEDLRAATSLCPEHVSTYNLQIELGTPLFDRVSHHALRITSEDLDADMYEYSIEQLTANGFRHYEISNFAKPGFECQHNINYWKMRNWIGIGAGAHSHVNGNRWNNTGSVEEYISTPSCLAKLDILPLDKGEKKSGGEVIFMGLRLLEGLDISKFEGFESEVTDLRKDGLLEESDNKIRLTKKGLFLGNLVFEKFV